MPKNVWLDCFFSWSLSLFSVFHRSSARSRIVNDEVRTPNGRSVETLLPVLFSSSQVSLCGVVLASCSFGKSNGLPITELFWGGVKFFIVFSCNSLRAQRLQVAVHWVLLLSLEEIARYSARRPALAIHRLDALANAREAPSVPGVAGRRKDVIDDRWASVWSRQYKSLSRCFLSRARVSRAALGGNDDTRLRERVSVNVRSKKLNKNVTI